MPVTELSKTEEIKLKDEAKKSKVSASILTRTTCPYEQSNQRIRVGTVSQADKYIYAK